MKTEIVKIKGDWLEVVDDCRATVGKQSLGKEPSKQFKRKILIAEHSPIRDIQIKWKWDGIKSWIATHWVRHKWECFVKTQRSDRTGIPRDQLRQDALVTFTGDANAQALIDTMRKRLCYQASPETRQYAEDLKMTLRDTEPEISDVLVPNCVYRGGCPEMSQCGFFESFMEHAVTTDKYGFDSGNIQIRYDKYNEMFYQNRKVENNDV